MDLDPEQELIFTGSGEGEMKAWKIDHEALGQGLQETESGEVRRIVHSFYECSLERAFSA